MFKNFAVKDNQSNCHSGHKNKPFRNHFTYFCVKARYVFMKKFLLFLFAAFSMADLAAQTGQPSKNYQTTKTVIAAHFGYQYFAYHGLELGLAHARYSKQGGLHYVRAYALAGEVVFSDSLTAFGPKAGIWITGGAAMLSLGASASYYINKNTGSLRARPEIGFGLKRFRLVYGYQFTLTEKDFLPVNAPHIVTFSVLIDIKVLKRNQLGTDKPPKWKKPDGVKQ